MTSYHVTLGGRGLMIDQATYRRRLARLFAPKQTSGQPSYADLDLGGAYHQDEWGSYGQVQAEGGASDLLHRWGAGVDFHSSPGYARLGYSPANISAAAGFSQTGFRAMISWNGSLWLADDGASGDTRVYEWDGAALTLRHTWVGKNSGASVFCQYLGKLYLGNRKDGAVISASAPGTVWAVAFTIGGSCTGTGAMAVAQIEGNVRQRLYALGEEVTDGSANKRARLYRWDGSSLSADLYDLEESKARCMVNMGGTKLVFVGSDFVNQNQGALYTFDGLNGSRIQQLDDVTALSMAFFQGKVYLGMTRGEVWSWDGSKVQFEHALLNTQGAKGYTADVLAMTTWQGALWVGRWDATHLAGIERFDGTDWTLPHIGGPAQVTAVTALAVWSHGLYVGYSNSSSAVAAQKLTSAAYATTATLESSVQDAGLPDLSKSLRSVTIEHAALAASESIAVHYRLEDTGSWTVLGTSSTLGATSATFTFAAATAGKRFALRFVLTGPGTSTPGLRSAVVRYVLAASPKRVWEFAVVLDGTAELPLVTLDGTPDPSTGETISAALWTLKADAGPLTFVDVDGVSRAAWFTSYAEKLAEASQRRGRSFRGTVELVEA